MSRVLATAIAFHLSISAAVSETDQAALAVAAVKAMNEKGRDIPVMPDLEIVPPGPDVALDLRAYSGLLTGWFHVTSGVANCEVWIERIRADGAAFLTYGCNDPKYGKFVGRYRTKIESAGFSFSMPDGATVSFVRTGDIGFRASHSHGGITGEFKKLR